MVGFLPMIRHFKGHAAVVFPIKPRGKTGSHFFQHLDELYFSIPN
jgi:hypothetical protein